MRRIIFQEETCPPFHLFLYSLTFSTNEDAVSSRSISSLRSVLSVNVLEIGFYFSSDFCRVHDSVTHSGVGTAISL